MGSNSKANANSKIGLAVLVWCVIGAGVRAICGSERCAMAMGIVLGAGCLVLAVLACLVGPGGADAAEPVKRRKSVDVVG